ncbi:MAG: hypothetical protein E6713_02845 [Sporomusaceae bacterium]|nr:hypothetical protein [Sporomusaceae bacterium]
MMIRKTRQKMTPIIAATIEAERNRSDKVIPGFAPHDRREYSQPPVRSIQMTPAELNRYLDEKGKQWGRPLQSVKEVLS